MYCDNKNAHISKKNKHTPSIDYLNKRFTYNLLKIMGEAIKENKFKDLLELIKFSEKFKNTNIFTILDYAHNYDSTAIENSLEIVDKLLSVEEIREIEFAVEKIVKEYNLGGN